MSDTPRYTFYSFSHITTDGEAHWLRSNAPVEFYANIDDARNGILKLKADLDQDPDHMWRRLYLEKIEMCALTRDSLLALLNGNREAIIHLCTTIEIIE